MANAAAKKAAIARSGAAQTYQPIILGGNVLYLLLCYLWNEFESITVWGILFKIVVWGIQWFAYVGILDNAENRSSSDKKNLVGGSSLDILGITWVIQFGTVLFSVRFYWLLVLFPVWGAYSLYSTFAGPKEKKKTGGGGGWFGSSEPQQENNTEEDEALAERRKKRAERRRQKRF